MDVNVEFRKVIPITKAWEGDDGRLYIEGESSGPEIDKDNQFMTKQCVADMARQIEQTPVAYSYLDEHNKRGVMADLGTVVGAEITPEYHMRNRVRLDKDNPAAVLLWKKIHDKRKQFGMSIAGHVQELARKTVGDKVYRGFNRIRLDHIANTTKPSWAPSLGTLVAKSLEQGGFDWAEAPEYEGEIFAVVERARGEGKGVGGPKQGDGGADFCVCPKCGHKSPHEKGTPCMESKCPKCGVAMGGVEKASKPDPKAGKGYMLVAELLNRLNDLFGWEKYQDKVAEENRDAIPLQDVPALQPLFPVGSASIAPAKSFDPDGEETITYIEKAMEAMSKPDTGPGIHDIRTLADVYDRLFWLAQNIQDRDKAAGKKDGKKIVTQLKAAMSSIVGAMKQQIAKKSEQPKPLVYGEGGIVKEESMPGQALASFEQVDTTDVGTLPIVEKDPQPSVGAQAGSGLTSFQQVADDTEELIAKRQQAIAGVAAPPAAPAPIETAPTPVGAMVGEFGSFVEQVLKSEAPLAEKQAALAEVGRSFFGRLGEMLEGGQSEEYRIQAAVEKAVAPLAAEIENLRQQLAVAKSRPADEGEPDMVRKSLTIGVRPARAVEQQQKAPTFLELVRNPQGGGWAPQ